MRIGVNQVQRSLIKKATTGLAMLLLFASQQAMASSGSCLPSVVNVLNEDGAMVPVSVAELEKNSLFKGTLVPGTAPGTVQYAPSGSSGSSSSTCYTAITPLAPVHKVVTTDMNRAINVNVLLDNTAEQQTDRQLLDITLAANNGKAKITGHGIKYKPSKDWCGTDSFSYQITDGTDVVEETTTVNVQCGLTDGEQDSETNPLASTNPTYTAKVFDVDRDGFNDVYIATKNGTRVKDFYLKQTFNAKFSLRVATVSDELAAFHQPESNIVVTRSDFNADGMYDFIIANIDEYIWGAEDQIVITKRGNSQAVGKLVPVDNKFRAVRDGIEAINKGGSTNVFVGLYDNQLNVCRTIYLPYYVWDSSRERWVLYWIPYTMCISGRYFLSNNLKNPEHFDYIKSLSKMNARYGLNNFQGPAGSWHDSVFSTVASQSNPRQWVDTARSVRNGVQIWRSGSITATVVLISNDITIVGAIDDVALIATVSSVVVSYILIEALDYYIAEMNKDTNGDTGEEDRSRVGAGKFAIPANCNPQTPGQKEAGNKPGSSEDLRENLKNSNCGCVNLDVKAAAHHIIPKKAGGDVGAQLRQCLKNRNIDIDSAINGVCLPMVKRDTTDAFLHSGSEGVLHSQRIQGLLDYCKSNVSREQFIAKLREIADGYTKGIIILP